MSARKELEAIFGAMTETYSSDTARALSMPGGVTKEIAAQAVENLDLAPILRDIGLIVARQIATDLEAMALRPADYVDLPDMPQMVAARLGAELSTAPTDFVAALLEQLKSRG